MRLTRWLTGSVLLALAMTGLAWGEAPIVTVPAAVKGEPGVLLKVQAVTAAKAVRWITLDQGVTLVPSGELKDPKTAWLVARKAGTYRLMALAAAGDEISEPALVTVTVEEAAVPDTLVADLKAAYLAEPAADRPLIGKLAALYKVAADGLGKPEAPFKTWGDLYKDMAAAAATTGVAGKLAGVQKVTGAHLAKRLPVDGTKALDADGRKLATATFEGISKALTEASK